MSIGTTVRKITFGEPHAHTTYNRPTEDLIAAIDTKYGDTAKDSTKNRTDAATDALLLNKVDKVAGKGLSTNDYTTVEKNKLAALEGSHWRGTYTSYSNLVAAISNPVAGDYADASDGLGGVVRYVYDVSLTAWTEQGGPAPTMTSTQIKDAYEDNPNTNAFTDAEKAKLSGIATAATKNATDAQLRDRATHTGAQAMSTITSLTTTLAGKADKTQLGTSAALDTGATAGKVMTVGTFGVGTMTPVMNINDQTKIGWSVVNTSTTTGTKPTATGVVSTWGDPLGLAYQEYTSTVGTDLRKFGRRMTSGTPTVWQEMFHTGNMINLGTTPASARTALELEVETSITYSPWQSTMTVSGEYDCTRIESALTTITIATGIVKDIILIEYKKPSGGTEQLTFSNNVDVGTTNLTVIEGESTLFSLMTLGGTKFKLIRMGAGYRG